MDNENMEALLLRLIEVNEQVSEQLTDIKSDLGEIRSEMDWAKDLSFAKQINDTLNSIDSRLIDIDTNLT